MILEAVELRNWRNVREPRRVRFEQGLNLVVGPNEVGKSSLLEGILRVLLDRHTSRTAELRRIRPWGSSLAPEVTLWARVGDRRLRIEKRFLSDVESRVLVERSGRWELDHEGDKADQYVRRLLFEDSGRGASKAAQRGVAQALWFLQRDEPLPRSWSRSLEEGVSGLVDQVFTDPREDAVAQRLHSEVAAHLTPTGRLSARSELKRLQDELAERESELDEREGDLERLRSYFDELATLAAERDRQRERESPLRSRAAESNVALERAPEVEQALEAAREVAAQAERRLEESRRLQQEVAGVERQVEESERELRKLEQTESELRSAVREQRRLAERHARRWEDELQPKVQRERAQIADLRTKMRIEELEAEYATLSRRAARLGELEQALEAARTELEQRPPVEASELERARRLAGRIEVLRAQKEASAIVVDLALEPGVEVKVRPDDRADGTASRLLITRPTELEIEGVGTLHLRSNDAALAELHESQSRYEVQLEEILRRAECETVDELASSHELGDRAARRLEEVTARRQELLGDHEDGTQLQSRVEEVQAELAEMCRKAPQATLPGLGGWAEERTLDELRAHEATLERLEAEMASERDAEQVAQQHCLERNEVLNTTSQKLAGQRSTSRILREQLDRLQSQRHSGGQLELAEAEAAFATAGEQVEKARQQWREMIQVPRQQLAEVEASLGKLREAQAATDRQLSDRRGRVEEVGSLGLHATVDGLRAEVSERRALVVQLARRVEALRLLDALWTHHANQQVAQVVSPVRQLVDRWWRQLADGRYSGVVLGDDLLPSAVQATGHDEAQPLESLSHGAFEQIAVLVRLALGVLLSQEERQLVVLDDGLVNSDSARMERMAPILEEVAEHCQVLIATCRPDDYQALNPHRIELEFTGRWEPRVVEVSAGAE